ncbi:unnamed protein product [Rotaria sordida]|uniref:Uncharacterized protein n=1 Tax=Rotaria sordida TaxID=392033 RepID=A0A819I0R3_9BILA|nr:unnamed protein product [Rotaria sordida]
MSNNLQSNILISSDNLFQTNNSFTRSNTIDNAILRESITQELDEFCNNPLIFDEIRQFDPKQSTTVIPINLISELNGLIECDPIKMLNDFQCQQKFLQSDIIKSKKIQIRCQPRSKFRPRTQNESKISSHYLRCENGGELGYPAIYIPKIWSYQSDINIIEVALVDILKQAHLYAIDNKTSQISYDDQAFIFKDGPSNQLYFRVTNEDFNNGYKTFMIELIKSKQDNIITKELIRSRKLYQSMLRFTRIYRDEYGKFQRDEIGQEYSSIMTEHYGDVSVEHMGPKYGSINKESMIFVVLKGRFVKNDISIMICEQTTQWSDEIKKFILNGNLIYFNIPYFPYQCINNIKANVIIYYKNQKIHESTYLYMHLSDEQFFDFPFNESMSNIDISMSKNKFSQDMANDIYFMPLISQKISQNKPRKRLNNKLA